MELARQNATTIGKIVKVAPEAEKRPLRLQNPNRSNATNATITVPPYPRAI